MLLHNFCWMLAILNSANGTGKRNDKVARKTEKEESYEEYEEYGEYGEVLDETLIPKTGHSYEEGSDYKHAHEVADSGESSEGSGEEYQYEESGSGSDGGGSDYDFSLPGSSLFRSSRVGNSLPGEKTLNLLISLIIISRRLLLTRVPW